MKMEKNKYENDPPTQPASQPAIHCFWYSIYEQKLMCFCVTLYCSLCRVIVYTSVSRGLLEA